jgi:hypothetical protein
VATARTPQDEDVVVTRESASAGRYTVRQVPGAAQFATSTREEAITLARSFGLSRRLDVWYCENGTYRLLEAYRSEAADLKAGHVVTRR